MGSTESTGHGRSPLWAYRLTTPSPLVTDPAGRRTARLLSALLLLIVPLGVLSAVLQTATTGEIGLEHLAIAAAVTAIALNYFVSRTRHYRVAAVVTTLVPTVAGLSVFAADQSDPGWFAFMAMSPALGSLLVSTRIAVVLAGVNLLGVVGAVILATELDPAIASVAVTFNAIIMAILLTARHHRDRLEEDRQAESRTRQRLNERILAGTFGGIAVHHDGVVAQANEAFAELFGASPEEVPGLRLPELFEPDSVATLNELLDDSDGKSVELVARRADGSTFHAEVLVPVGVGDDDFDQVLALHAISDRKEARDALVRAQRMESVGRLAAGIAHDTNNLLAVILIYSERLAEERAAAGLSATAERNIHNAAQQISTLLGRLHLVGRGRVDEPVMVDVRSFVADHQPMWRQVLDERIDLDIAVDEAVGQVFIDPTNLEQVLLNLVLNARDAMVGGGRLSVELRGDLLDGPVQCISVSDNGPGIAPEHLERVFEPFFTTKEEEIGTGIGLYTSREVIDAAGGALTVETSPGRTTFQVILPEASG